jgi:hypothetical protein
MTAILWNERQEDASPVNRAYDKLLMEMVPEYQNVSHRRVTVEEIRTFFTPGDVQLWTFANQQTLDLEAFLGRLISSSYVPNVGQPGHQEIIEAAQKIFDACQIEGRITSDLETKVYIGRFVK